MTTMYSTPMTTENMERLMALAEEYGAMATIGSRAGQPSWRTLLRLIAESAEVVDGALVLRQQGEPEPS